MFVQKTISRGLLSLCLAVGTVACGSKIPSTETVLCGKVSHWTGEGFLLSPVAYHTYDTIKEVASDGTFRYVRQIDKPEVITLYLEYMEGNKVKIPVYVANGKETKVIVTFSEGIGVPVP